MDGPAPRTGRRSAARRDTSSSAIDSSGIDEHAERREGAHIGLAQLLSLDPPFEIGLVRGRVHQKCLLGWEDRDC